jgi:hypothetical protein
MATPTWAQNHVHTGSNAGNETGNSKYRSVTMKRKLFALLMCLSMLASPLEAQNVFVANSGINLQTGSNYPITCADSLKLVQLSNASAQTPTMPNASTCGAGVVWNITNISTGLQTITPTTSNISYFNGSSYVSAAASMPLPGGQGATIYTDGTNYFAFQHGVVRTLGWAFGDVATGSALTTSEVGYITVPFPCTIIGYHIMADSGTVTIKTARINSGTALPTVGSNSISTSGVSLASGTKVDSTTVTDFTSTTLSANDTLGFFITTISGPKQITFQLDCAQ